MKAWAHPVLRAVVITAFLTCTHLGVLADEARSSVISRVHTSRANKEFLEDRLQSIRDFWSNESRTGLFLTTNAVPGAGRLLIRRSSQSGVDNCSGVAVNTGWFLTAAHCVCKLNSGDAKDARECNSHLAELELRVFIPREGLFPVGSSPIIHSDYKAPSYLQPGQVGNLDQIADPIADLALVKFEGGSEFASLEPTGRPGKFLLASFGTMYFAIEEYAAKMGFEIGRPIPPGVGQASRLQDLYSSRQDCGRYHAADTLCSRYSALQVEAGSLQDTTVCQGDSGSPVLRRDRDDSWSVTAIVSYFSPPNRFDRCTGTTSGQRTHYTDLSRYRHWIKEEVGWKGPAPTVLSCVDGIFKTGTMDLIGFRGLVTASSFNKKPEDQPRHTTITTSPAGYCNRDERFGLSSCKTTAPSYVRIEIASDFAQVTLCDGGEDEARP